MSQSIKIFVSYSHKDAEYLADDSLLGYLKGLEKEGVELWTDRKVGGGDLWDGEIKARIADCDIALVLVSQFFLDSKYCQDVEIRGFLEKKAHIFPVVLSACEWERHEWLRAREFLPGGQRTIEEDYRDPGDRKRLFLEIRQQLREQIERLRQPALPGIEIPAQLRQPESQDAHRHPNPFKDTLAVYEASRFVGREEELRRLRALLEGGSVVLLGEAKIGKSSLILQLARTWEGDVLGPIDFQFIEDPADFYDSLAEELALANSDWRSLRKELRKRQALLLLDELDAAPHHSFENEDMARLRAICGQNSDFKMVVVSSDPLKEIFPDTGAGSPAYNFLLPFTLGPMGESDIRRLLAPWGPDEPVFDDMKVEQIVKLADGHPFKAQRAAYHLYEALSQPSYDWLVAWEQDLEHML